MDLTPREIVAALDRHIVGQLDAKRAVAVAVRNRWRRERMDPELAREVAPKNIIMIGPTGVGKTEIARRLATLTGAPFLKVEATKYTEVGYHGRDVESMIRDLLELAIRMVRGEHAKTVREEAEAAVEDKLVSILLGQDAAKKPVGPEEDEDDDLDERVRQRMRERLREGYFDDREVEISVTEKQSGPLIGMMGPDQMDPGMASMIENLIPDRSRRRKVSLSRAKSILLEQEIEKLIDNEKITEQAIERTQEGGIVFLDEIDKIASSSDGRGSSSADVSRQGVQRDLLPIVEGCAVTTRHGVVHTDRILFVAAGAFHTANVGDLMPELQGRFPLRVELSPLTRDDFRRILVEPDGALTRQQAALLAAEGLEITFTESALDAMAELAAEANKRLENIGARRLMTVMECVFEEISFDAPDRAAAGETAIEITEAFVRERLGQIIEDEDLGRYVL